MPEEQIEIVVHSRSVVAVGFLDSNYNKEMFAKQI